MTYQQNVKVMTYKEAASAYYNVMTGKVITSATLSSIFTSLSVSATDTLHDETDRNEHIALAGAIYDKASSDSNLKDFGYDSADSSTTLDNLYTNILNRDADTAGKNSWTQQFGGLNEKDLITNFVFNAVTDDLDDDRFQDGGEGDLSDTEAEVATEALAKVVKKVELISDNILGDTSDLKDVVNLDTTSINNLLKAIDDVDTSAAGDDTTAIYEASSKVIDLIAKVVEAGNNAEEALFVLNTVDTSSVENITAAATIITAAVTAATGTATAAQVLAKLDIAATTATLVASPTADVTATLTAAATTANTDADATTVYTDALATYNAAVTAATASQTAATDAQTAYDAAPSQELATAFNTAATTATTDADAVTTAATALQTAATATTTTDDDAFAATAVTDAATAATAVGTLVTAATTAIGNYVNEVANTSADETLTGTAGVDNFVYDYAGANITDANETVTTGAGAGLDGNDTVASFTLGTDTITFNDTTGTVTDQASFLSSGVDVSTNFDGDLTFNFTDSVVGGISTFTINAIVDLTNAEHLALVDTDSNGVIDLTAAEAIELIGTDNVSFTAEIA